MTAPAPRYKKRALLAGAIALLLLAGWFGGSAALARVFESRHLRELIAAKIGREIKAPSGLLPLSCRGLSLYSDGLESNSNAPHGLTELRASRIYARSNLLELWRGHWRVEKLSAEHLQAAFGKSAAAHLDRNEFAPPRLEPPSRENSALSLDVRETVIARTDLAWGEGENTGNFREVTTRYYPDGKNLIVHGQGGTFQQAKLPEARVRTCKLYYTKPALHIDEGALTLGGDSSIRVLGGFDFGEKSSMDLQLRFEQCPAAPFLSEEMRARFSATFGAEMRLQSRLREKNSMTAEGEATVTRAVLKNVPALEKIAAFTGKTEFRELAIDRISGSYEWRASELTVRNLSLEAKRLIAVKGEGTLRKGGIEATLQLGATAEVLAAFPGARAEVFTTERAGYFWTTVRLSGPMEHLHDDLKPRLLAAAQASIAKGILGAIFKPRQTVIEKIEQLY